MANYRSESGLSYTVTKTPDSGGKPWVVFCHGVGMKGDAWTGWFPNLLSDYRILTFDARGYGESLLREGEFGSRTLDDWVGDLISLLDEEGIEQACMIGESLGGTAVLHTAARHPERVTACVVCSTGFRGSLISEISRWPGIVAEGGIEAWSEYMNARRFNYEDPQSLWEAVHEIQMASSVDVIVYDAQMLGGSDLSEELATMDKPTLILAPGSSPFISREHSQELEDVLPNSSLIMFGNVKHGLAFALADECAYLAGSFFKRARCGVARSI